jgi:biopolymer transport protein ExbD
MAKKAKKDFSASCEVPIAAMIDVVFLLLIYFILNAKEVVDEAWVAVNLPGPPVGPPPKDPPQTVDIFVQSDAYFYQGNRKNLEEIERTIMGFSAMTEVTVNIKVSLKAKHSSLVLLLDRLNKHKLEKFNIHTLKPQLSQ